MVREHTVIRSLAWRARAIKIATQASSVWSSQHGIPLLC